MLILPIKHVDSLAVLVFSETTQLESVFALVPHFLTFMAIQAADSVSTTVQLDGLPIL